jgi:gluconolactonase
MRRLATVFLVIVAMAAALPAQDIPLSKILLDKEPWREAGKDLPGITFLEADPGGKLLVYQGAPTVVLGAGGKVDKIPKGITLARTPTVATTAAGGVYSIDEKGKSLTTTVAGKNETFKLPGLAAPTSLTLWPDEGHLVIGEADGAWLWAVRIDADGKLGPGDRYYSLRTRPGEKLPVTAMIMDAGGLLYACTPLGIQVFDPTGRLSGVIAAPVKETMTAVTIGGDSGDQLFVAAGDKVYSRRIQAKAIYAQKKGG